MARVKLPLSAAGRVHDMGGQPGGPVPIDPQGQPVFAQNWQARALAVTVAAGGLGKWTLDESRHARERLPAEDYMAYGYYEKWMAGLATLLVEHGLVTMDELRSGQVAAEVHKGLNKMTLSLQRQHRSGRLLPGAARLGVQTERLRAMPAARRFRY